MSERQPGEEQRKPWKKRVKKGIGSIAATAAAATSLAGCYGPSSQELATEGVRLTPDQLTSLQADIKQSAVNAIDFVLRKGNPYNKKQETQPGELLYIFGSDGNDGPNSVMLVPELTPKGSQVTVSISRDIEGNDPIEDPWLSITFSNVSSKFGDKTMYNSNDMKYFIESEGTRISSFSAYVPTTTLGGIKGGMEQTFRFGTDGRVRYDDTTSGRYIDRPHNPKMVIKDIKEQLARVSTPSSES